jgi:hypothetical protein
MDEVRKEIENSDAEMILYFSTQWLTVLGYLFQADPNPKWTLVDSNWHEFGSMPYEFKVDTKFATSYASEVKSMGHYTREVNYRGFPIDTGTVVAQKLLNPGNRLPAAMASCNMYAEKQETLSIGQAAMRAIEKRGLSTVVVCVTGLSSRYHTEEIEYSKDRFLFCQRRRMEPKDSGNHGRGSPGRHERSRPRIFPSSQRRHGISRNLVVEWFAGKTNDFTGKVFGYEACLRHRSSGHGALSDARD